MRDQSTEHQKPSSADAPAKAAVTMTELSDEQLDLVNRREENRRAVGLFKDHRWRTF